MLHMPRYAEHASPLVTSQSEQARSTQRQNNAGGFSFVVDRWARLDRFLVLGAEGGTYYVGERKLTRDNAKCIDECIAEDGLRTVRRIVEVSDAGRAPKNDPAIFALALCAGATNPVTRAAALAAIPKVCRIGTHLFHFVNDVEGARRWGRSLRRAVSAWYTDRPVDALALQAIKYQQRDGWSHRDVLRLAHPKAPTKAHDAVLRWIASGSTGLDKDTPKGKGHAPDVLPAMIRAFMEIHAEGTTVARAIDLIREHRLPHECVPNEMKGDPRVWEAMLDHMGITAVIRNLAKMTSIGLLAPMSSSTQKVAAMLTDTTTLFKGRVHPLSVLLAMKTYEGGHGLLGSLTWTPERAIVDALNEAFYLSFQAIEPTGKRHFLALDVSGSMTSHIAGTSLSCREASAAMAMVTARSEKLWHCAGFAAGGFGYGLQFGGADSKLVPLAISPTQRLDDVVRTIQKVPMGGTDCSLPMLHAMEQKLEVDAFVVYTDSETWTGKIHPFQALTQYRQKMGINAKLIVVGMTATEFTIADPSDAGMLDVVGFDAAAPGVMADFVASREVDA